MRIDRIILLVRAVYSSHAIGAHTSAQAAQSLILGMALAESSLKAFSQDEQYFAADMFLNNTHLDGIYWSR